MFIDFLAGLAVLASLFGGQEPTVGAFGDPFLSVQLAASPTNTYVLTTDGTNNVWSAPGAASADGTWSTTSADYWKTLRNFYSTTSADYWLTTKNITGFSTTSADFWKSVNNFFSTTSASFFSSAGLSWSTTSADYWETQQAARGGSGSGFSTTSADYYASLFDEWKVQSGYLVPTTTRSIIVNASSTIGSGTVGLTVSGPATTTGRTYIGPSDISFATNGPLGGASQGFGNLTMACNGCGANSANILSIANFGGSSVGINTFSARGTAASPSATQASDVLYLMGGRGFGTSVWNNGSKAAIQYVASQTHTDSANGTYITLETTPNNSTTRAERVRIDQDGTLDFNAYNCSANANGGALTVDASGNVTCTDDDGGAGGSGFSTTSADYWKSVNNFFSTSSADYWKTENNFFSTTSADLWKSVSNFFSTTSANVWSSFGLGFSTTSAQNFVHTSTTIPKMYTANSYNLNQTFGAISIFDRTGSASFSNSVDGIASLSTGNLDFMARGSQSFYLDSNNNGADAFKVFGNSSTNEIFRIDDNGMVGIGTTSPYAMLSVGGDVVAARFVATTSLASVFPFASTTALSATTLCISTDCRTEWPTSGGAGFSTTSADYWLSASTSVVINGTTTMDRLRFLPSGGAAGSASRAAIGRTDAVNTGIYFGGTGDVSVTSAGTQITQTNAAGILSTQQFISGYAAQDALNPAFAFSGLSLGMYKIDNSTLGFTAGAAERLRLSASGATTTGGFAVTNLVSCNTIDTDSSGNFRCGTDETAAGAANDFNFASTYGAINAATSSNVWVQGALNASSTLNVSGLASFSNFLDIQGWRVSTSTTVCAVGCEYTSIQTAIDAGWKDITLKAETYAGPVSIKNSDTTIRGAGMYNTTISCAGGLCVSVATSSSLTRITLEDFGIDSTSAGSGIGLDTSMTSNVYAERIRITDFDLGHLVQDGNAQQTFYHGYTDMVYFDNNNCFKTASTTGQNTNNLVNDHQHTNPRCRVASATGVGYDIINSEGWLFTSPNAEPGSTIGTGMRIDGNSLAIQVVSPWFENNATGTEIASGALMVKFQGGRITGNTIGVWNRGLTTFDSVLISANTTNVNDTTTLGSYWNTSTFYAQSFLGIGTSTPHSAQSRLAIANSSSATLDSQMIITNAGAFAAAWTGIDFRNSAGDFRVAAIGATPGSGYAASSFVINVANAAKTLVERFKVDVDGRASANFFTATSTTGSSVFPFASSTALSATTLCLSTDCRTAWPTGGSGVQSVATSAVATRGALPYWTSSGATPETLGSIATGTVSAGTGISLSATAYVLLNALSIAVDQAANFAWTGAHDFGAAVLEITNGTASTVDAVGEIALDTTDNQLIIATSTNASHPAVIPTRVSLGSFIVSSTSAPFFTGFSTGKSIPFKIHSDGYRVTEIVCDIDSGTSIVVNFDNGTGNSNTVTCDTDGASVAVGTNGLVSAGAVTAAIETGTVSGAPDYLRVSVFGVYIRE